jgi:zinc protease
MEGTSESVMALSQADVKYFYQQYYVLKNAIITIIGDVSFKEAENIVNKIAENLPAGKEAAAIIPVPAHKAVGHRHITFPSEQANVYMGHLGIRHHDPDYYALYIGNDILGGSSITSRLFTQIRGEQGLVYGINSSFQFSDAKGPFLINFATKNSSVKKALALIRSILKDYVLRGPTQKEFQLAKQKINNEFPLSLATNSDISHYLVKIGFYKLPLDYIDKYRDNISAVSLEHVKAALKKHIHLDDMMTVVVGP